MSYIYDATSATTVAHNANIPIVRRAGSVLLTTEKHWYAGPRIACFACMNASVEQRT